MSTPSLYRTYSYPSHQDAALRREIESLRHYGTKGGYIAKHRAMLTSRGGWSKAITGTVLSLVLFVGWLFALRWVPEMWARSLSFWSEALALGGSVTLVRYHLGAFSFEAPYLAVAAGVPDATTIIVGWILSILIYASTYLFPRYYLPLTYAVRIVVGFHAVAQLFFTLTPSSFPYDAGGYIHGVLIAGLGLIGLVPLVLGFTFSIFDHVWWRKAGLAILIMTYLAVFIPMQFAMHAFILHHLSLLVLPVLFFAFGLAIDVMAFIGLYSWGASWRHNLQGDDSKRVVGR